MRKARVLMAVIALGLAVSVGHALADGPSAGFSGAKVAQIKFLDPQLNLVQLSDGMELRAPDRNMLTNLKVGEWVKVDFVSDGERAVINEIEAAQPDEIPGPTPTAVGGGITNHG
ncbi:MAG TPA: hypothetical protein VFE97_01245 [Methylomirabilota bacterium]|nr:hypothetical protein [Methylomirabilota bacterium]